LEQEKLRRAIAWATVRAQRRGRPPETDREKLEDQIASFVLGGESGATEPSPGLGPAEGSGGGGKPPVVVDEQRLGHPTSIFKHREET